MVCDEGLAPPLHQQSVRLTERHGFLQVRITVTHVHNQLGIKIHFPEQKSSSNMQFMDFKDPIPRYLALVTSSLGGCRCEITIVYLSDIHYRLKL